MACTYYRRHDTDVLKNTAETNLLSQKTCTAIFPYTRYNMDTFANIPSDDET